jgi:hypothetical protein
MKAINFKQVYARVAPWALPFLVVLFLLSLFTCNRRSGALADLRLDLDSVARQARQFENEKGQVITQNQVLKAESAQQIRDLTDTIFNLKREDRKKVKQIRDYTRIIQEFKTGPKFAPFIEDAGDFTRLADNDSTQTADAPERTRDSNYIRVPRPFLYWDSTVQFAGRVTRLGVWLDSIRIENRLHFRTVVEKTGFLNMGRKTSVQVLNSNPAITTLGVTKIQTANRPNWWNKWGKPAVFAILGGIVGHQITR